MDAQQTTAAQKINSTLWFALEKAGDKSKDQKNRNLLEGGSRIPVTLSVDGRVDGVAVATTIIGHLQVAFDGTTSSKTKPTAEQVLAIALSYVPKTKRPALLESGLVEPDPQLLEIATAFVETNTVTAPKPRRGAVSFEFGPID